MNDTEKLSKKDIKKITKKLRALNIFPHIKYKQIIIDGVYYPYIISSYGEVYALHYRGIKNNLHKMKQKDDKDGYTSITLAYNNKPKTFLMHRLVANAFIPNNRKEAIQINHKNGKKHNNRVNNLEWVTPSENLKHAYKNKLAYSKCGEESGLSKYTNDQIEYVCMLLEQNLSFKDITKRTGVDRGMIYYIYNKKLWKSISKKYDFSNYSYRKPVDRIRKIHKVCKLLEKNKHSIKEIEEITGIKAYTIRDILNEKYYTDISSQYNIHRFNKNKNK